MAEAEADAARLRRIVDRVDQEIYVCEAGTLAIIDANASATGNLGHSLDELRARTLLDICAFDADVALDRERLRLSGGNSAAERQGINRRSDGSRYPVAVRLERETRGGLETFVAYVKVSRDPANMAAKLQQATRAAQWYFTEWNLETGRIERDPAIDRLYGFEDHDPSRGAPEFRARVHPHDLAENLQQFQSVTCGDAAMFDRSFRVFLPHGGTRWVRAIGQLSSDDPNVVVGLQSDVTAAVMTQRAAETTRSDLSTLLGHLPDYISRAAPDTTLRYVNGPYSRFLGQEACQIIGQKFLDFVPEEHRDALRAALSALTPEAPMISTEERTVAADGTVTCLLWTNLMTFEDGTPVELISVGRDISEQDTAIRTVEAQARDLQRSNAALRMSEERFRALYNDTPVMLHSSDAEGRIVAVSDFWLESLGYRRDDVLGRSPLDFLTPQSRDDARTIHLPRFFASGHLRDAPYQFVKHDGSIIDCLLSATAVLSEDGAFERALAVVVDVTDKKRAEEALARNQRELQLIFDNAPVLIWYKDDQNRILRLNKRAAEMFGRPVEEAEGRDANEFLPSELAERFHSQDLEVIRSGIPKRQIIEERTSPEGNTEWMSTDKVPYVDPETGRTLLLATSTNITDLRNAQLTMAAQAEALQQSNEDLEQFAYVASHDLKAPLRGIDSLAGWIEDDCGDRMDETSRDNMRLLRGRVARLDDMLNGLLQYARVGRAKTDVAEIDLQEVVAAEFDLVRGERAFSLECGALPIMHTGVVPLQLVLRNLISNAIKHHDRDQGSITVTCTDAGTRYRVSVADDGPGILPEHHRRAFGMFQVLKSRDRVEGSGLGLAVIEKQLRTLSCAIRVESDPAAGRGTTFHFTWPKQWPYSDTAVDPALDGPGNPDADETPTTAEPADQSALCSAANAT